jgi:hypothetical protein
MRHFVAELEFIGKETNSRVGAGVFPKNCLSGRQALKAVPP